MKDAIDAGKLGKPVLILVQMLGWREPSYYLSDPWRGTWAGEGGGVVVSQAPHYLDLLSWFMGPAIDLHGYWDNYNHPSIEVDDTVVTSVRFQNGGMGSIVLSNSQRPGLFGNFTFMALRVVRWERNRQRIAIHLRRYSDDGPAF